MKKRAHTVSRQCERNADVVPGVRTLLPVIRLLQWGQISWCGYCVRSPTPTTRGVSRQVVYGRGGHITGSAIKYRLRSRGRGLVAPPNNCENFSNLESIQGDVKFYYGLSKYYQNNRLYFNSRNDQQLRGKVDEVDGCEPLKFVLVNGTKVPIVPCGVVANSMFNDVFELFYIVDSSTNGTTRVPWTTRGVLGATEMKRKFANPVRAANQTLCDVFEVGSDSGVFWIDHIQGTIKPPAWRVPICKLGVNSTDPDVGIGFENIDFMVWMKVAALPKFRKLYRILNRQVDMFSNGLPKGQYQLRITYSRLISYHYTSLSLLSRLPS